MTKKEERIINLLTTGPKSVEELREGDSKGTTAALFSLRRQNKIRYKEDYRNGHTWELKSDPRYH